MAQELLKAAKQGDLDALNEALAAGANVDVRVHTFGSTVFGAAAKKGISFSL